MDSKVRALYLTCLTDSISLELEEFRMNLRAAADSLVARSLRARCASRMTAIPEPTD